jgi:hypothetical protein
MRLSVKWQAAIPRFSLCLLAVTLILSCSSLMAQPRTLYKPRDIENARENALRHGWARSIVASWERGTEFAMKQDRDFFVALIPDLTPGTTYGQNCPACVGVKSLEGETGLFGWSIDSPDQVKCSRCGTVFPNDEYPETGVLECPHMGQSFTYYQPPAERALEPDATPQQRREHALLGLSQRPQMTSLSSLIRMRKIGWAWGQALALAKLYAVTEQVEYAERVAWILNRFAEVYPNYLYHSYDGSYADWPPSEVAANLGDPATPRGGRFAPGVVRHAYGLHEYSDDGGQYSTLYNGFWGAGRLATHGKGSDAGPLLSITVAYDLTRDARYQDGTPVYDEQMHQRILDDLIISGCSDMECWDDLSNKGVATLSLSAAVGALLLDPAHTHRALNGFRKMMSDRYHFDGFYSESPGYAEHNFGNVRELPDLLYGYSDPPDYQPEDGSRVEDFNPFEMGHFNLALLAMVRQLAPGNRLPTIGDTFFDTTISPLYAEVLAARLGGPYAGLLETIQGKSLPDWGSEYSLWYRDPDLVAGQQEQMPLRSEWFPGWHVGVLRGSSQDNDTALFFNGNEHRWTISSGHRQPDILSISHYAFGQELASDRGYFSGSNQLTADGRPGQAWTASTMSHNLVVVDEQRQNTMQCGSNLELFGATPGVEVIQASGYAVYPQCDDYRRTCAMIRTPDGGHYVVDFFRVTGGQTHQYSFHCNGEMVHLNPSEPAPEPTELSAVWSRWLENPRAVIPTSPYTFTWQQQNVNLDLLMLNTTDSVDRIIIADAPGWRRAVTSEWDKPPIQQILVEKRGDEGMPLTTQYAAVIVPYTTEASPVLSARLLHSDDETGAMAVEVRFADRTDYIVSALDQEERSYGPITASAQFAVVSVDAQDQVVQAYLLAGTTLRCGQTELSLPQPSTTLTVTSVSDRTFTLAEALPTDLAPAGTYLLADGPRALTEELPRPRTGFEIESTTTNSVTVRDYPVLECDEITVLHSAWLQHEG